MELVFLKAWFASEKLMNNQARLFNLSDQGSLRFEAGMLEFTGRKQTLRISKIERIDLICPRVPWISVAYSFLLIFIILGVLISRLPSEFLLTSFFITLPFLSIALPFSILLQKALLWVEVTFVDDAHVTHRVYFSDASRLWSSTVGTMLGDTLKMYKELIAIQSSVG